MSTFTSKFPLEVIEAIVDCLAAQDDKSFSSVKACSLVSRSLLPRTRSYIYSYIAIHPRYKRTTVWMFERLISATPVIAHYVTSLYLGILVGDLDNVREGCSIEGLVRALGSLTRLQELDLSLDYNSWQGLTIIKASILNLMHLPTLTHLRLQYFSNFELSDLTLCVGLKHLDISHCSTEDGSPIEIYQDTPPRLESFTGAIWQYSFESQPLLQLCTARRTDGKPIIDTTELKILRLEIDESSLDDLEEVFTHFTQLTSFEMIGCEALLQSSDFPDLFLPSLQTLRNVHLRMYIDEILPLASRFASVSGKNVIKSIKLSIHILKVAWDDDEWSALDQVFTHSELDWKELASFSLHFQILYPSSYEMEDLNNLVQNLQTLPATVLKGLASNKNIVFDLQVSSS